jgi:hypothetical protein
MMYINITIHITINIYKYKSNPSYLVVTRLELVLSKKIGFEPIASTNSAKRKNKPGMILTGIEPVTICYEQIIIPFNYRFEFFIRVVRLALTIFRSQNEHITIIQYPHYNYLI